GLGVEDRRGTALLPPSPWARRGGGLEDDRQRLHRADHQGAADGVRRGDEPPDRAPDGGLDWIGARRRSRSRTGLSRGAARAPLWRVSWRCRRRRTRGG